MGIRLYEDLVRMQPPDPEPWMADAACAEVDPDLFFQDSSGPARTKTDRMAKGICEGCEVRLECLAYTLKNEALTSRRYGVAGGMTPIERSKLEARLGIRKVTNNGK